MLLVEFLELVLETLDMSLLSLPKRALGRSILCTSSLLLSQQLASRGSVIEATHQMHVGDGFLVLRRGR